MGRAFGFVLAAAALFLFAVVGGIVNGERRHPLQAAATVRPTIPVTMAPDLSAQTRDTPGRSASPFPVSPQAKNRVATFLERADQLYSDASAIIAAGVPATETAVAEKVAPGSDYSDFQDADRKFQSDVRNVPRYSPLEAVYDNLAEFEEFAWSGVYALASCNGDDAHLNMMVAKAFLDEAHRNYHGIYDDNWTPPDITEKVTNKDDCIQD